MNSNYEIFRQRSDGSFERIESVNNIEQAKTDLNKLVAGEPGDYRLWDSFAHKFIDLRNR
jgi:hypothetical protein